MINKKQIAEMAQKILRHSEGLRDHKIMHPERDWFIGLLLAVVIFTASAGWGIYTYWKNKNPDVSLDLTATEETVVYRESVVKDALDRFEKRNKEREALVAGFSEVSPPPTPAPVEVATSSVEQKAVSIPEGEGRVASSTVE